MVDKPMLISGESAPNLELELKIANDTMNIKTNTDGQWSTEYTPTIGGLHTVTVSLKNHYMYKDFKNTTTFNVLDNRINANSTINLPEEAIVNEEIIISGILKDEHGKTIPKVELNLTIQNENYTVTTDKNGYWSLPYTPRSIGKHTITISLTRHLYFYDFTNTTTLTVSLKDERGKTVPKTELSLTINKENYTVTTDKNGYWSLPYTPSNIGEHTVTISLTRHPYLVLICLFESL